MPIGSPAAPFVVPMEGDLETRLSAVAAAINGKADKTGAPTFGFVRLVSPNGTTYAVSVNDAGALVTSVVTR